MRARLFAERGWVGVVDPDDLTPEVLADAVLNELTRTRTPGEEPDLCGLRVAVGQILALLDLKAVHDDARPTLLEV
jgi:predicted glycosyltransferase